VSGVASVGGIFSCSLDVTITRCDSLILTHRFPSGRQRRSHSSSGRSGALDDFRRKLTAELPVGVFGDQAQIGDGLSVGR